MDVIEEAYEKGVVCAGYSAGASLFYTYGYSDLKDDGSFFGYVKGMDLIKGAFCPQAQQQNRAGFFQEKEYPQLSHYACEDGNAYLTEDGNTRPFYQKKRK